MRTIKFRVWNGVVMVYDVTVGVHGVFYTNGISREDISSLDDTTLYPETIPVMQFTGLHDKNGKEIYEGDIFKINGKICFVEWNEDMAGFILTTGKGYDTSNMFDFNCDSIYYSEIIGNIHETPELL